MTRTRISLLVLGALAIRILTGWYYDQGFADGMKEIGRQQGYIQ